MSDDQGESPLEQRVERLEAGQENTNSRLDEVLALLRKVTGGAPATHEAAEQQTEQHLDRPSSVAEQVRAELARKEAQDAEAAEKKSVRDELAELRSKMTEKQPEPPQPRRQKVMWGPR